MGGEARERDAPTWDDLLNQADLTCYSDLLKQGGFDGPETFVRMGHDNAMEIMREITILPGHRFRLWQACLESIEGELKTMMIGLMCYTDLGASKPPPTTTPGEGTRIPPHGLMSVTGDEGPDKHGRQSKKGGNQVMHFGDLRLQRDTISHSSEAHISPPMVELLFHRRGACMTNKERTLLVYLCTVTYMSKVTTTRMTGMTML